MPPATASSTIGDFLSPQTLAEIENYQLLAKVAVDGFLAGAHRSLHRGTGSEFLQYRNYVSGDDPKYVDWQLYARLNRLCTKVFQEETNMNCCVVLDASASMGYQGEGSACSKLRYASMLAACFAYLAFRQTDNVGFYGFSDGLVSVVPPARRTGQLRRVFGELGRLTPSGTADAETVLPLIGEGLRERGVVVLLSDFMTGESTLTEQLRMFRARRHECVVFHILDPDELSLPFRQTTRFVDSETGEHLVTYPETMRGEYRASMRRHVERIREACLSSQTDYRRVRSDEDLGGALSAYLHHRGRCGPW